jgi:hypothetical protein
MPLGDIHTEAVLGLIGSSDGLRSFFVSGGDTAQDGLVARELGEGAGGGGGEAFVIGNSWLVV